MKYFYFQKFKNGKRHRLRSYFPKQIPKQKLIDVILLLKKTSRDIIIFILSKKANNINVLANTGTSSLLPSHFHIIITEAAIKLSLLGLVENICKARNFDLNYVNKVIMN